MSVYKISKFPFGMLIFMQQYTRKSGLIHKNRQKACIITYNTCGLVTSEIAKDTAVKQLPSLLNFKLWILHVAI